ADGNRARGGFVSAQQPGGVEAARSSPIALHVALPARAGIVAMGAARLGAAHRLAEQRAAAGLAVPPVDVLVDEVGPPVGAQTAGIERLARCARLGDR